FPGQQFQTDQVDMAIQRGIDYLVAEQLDGGSMAGAIVEGQDRKNAVAMTSLSIMAMAAVGHQPSDPTPEGKAMRRALEFVLEPKNQLHEHYYGADGSRMYGHGITTLMLAEMLGMGVDDAQDQKIRARLQNAVNLILAAQQLNKRSRSQGGWRYTPQSNDSDLSVSVWQVMALRSAKNAGLPVPKSAIDSAVEYIRSCYHPSQGGFGYQPGRHPDYAMVAAGLLSMQVCGQYDADEVKGAAEWLSRRGLNFRHHWFFYGTYYYAQGMYQRGGRYAEQARTEVEDVLLRNQAEGGYWSASSGQERGAGRIYSTTMAILSLSVKYHYLPIYQR
ncbi:MAG: terpene cyclase/mutase family protein, partial [Pirellulales bacterium]|nr:terpene cyclase/mutase family protein [Pirellulales bacterium]